MKSRKRPPSTDCPGLRSSSGRPRLHRAALLAPDGAWSRADSEAPLLDNTPLLRWRRGLARSPSLPTRRQLWAEAGVGEDVLPLGTLGRGQGRGFTYMRQQQQLGPRKECPRPQPQEAQQGRSRRGPRSRSSSRERGAGRLSSRPARVPESGCTKSGLSQVEPEGHLSEVGGAEKCCKGRVDPSEPPFLGLRPTPPGFTCPHPHSHSHPLTR